MKKFQQSRVNTALAHHHINLNDDELALMDEYLYSPGNITLYQGYTPKGITANRVIGSFVGAIIGLALFPVMGPLGFQLGIVIGGLIGSLFERKKKPKEDQKFKPEAQFNQELVVAKYGDPVAMIFCNRDDNEYGGVRVSGNLINARVTNVLGEEYVKMLFVIGAGELGSATQDPYDLTGFQFGEEKIDLATNDDVTVKTTRGIALQDSFNNEFPYASQVKTPEQNKSCSSKYILELPSDSTGGSSFPSQYTFQWTNLPNNAIRPVSNIFGNGFQSQLSPNEYYKLINTTNGGNITNLFSIPASGKGAGTVSAIYTNGCEFGITNLGGINYYIYFDVSSSLPRANVIAGSNQVAALTSTAIGTTEFFFRFTDNGVNSTIYLEIGYRENLSPTATREEILYENELVTTSNQINTYFNYAQNPLILTPGNTTPINWVIGARGGNITVSQSFTRINLNQELIGAISYGTDYLMYERNSDTESEWFRFTEINTVDFYAITNTTVNFPKGSYLYSVSEFTYETSKPVDILEINMFGVIWSRNKKTGELTYDTQMFDVYTNIKPDGGYRKVQRFFISSNNTSGIKRQIRLVYNNKNYRSVKIRPVIQASSDIDIRKIEPNLDETTLFENDGNYQVQVKFQEDEISLNNPVPDDPFNPTPPGQPVPSWLTNYLSIFKQAKFFSHSSETADPLVVNSINEAAYYPPNFDGTYSGYAMYSVITRSTIRTNPVNPSIVVKRGIRGKQLTGYAKIVTKESRQSVLVTSSDFLVTDTVYCPRLNLVILPSAITSQSITVSSRTLQLLSVGDILITYRLANISRWPDVFNHVLTDSKYLGDIVNQLLIDYVSLIESKNFVIQRQYFYDFAQLQSVSFQQWALANSAFSLLLPKKSGGKYGLMPIVRTDIKGMFSNYEILIDSYAESSVPYKDTDIDNLGVKTIDGRENRYRERQVGVIRNTNFNYSFVIDAQSITREQQGKDFAVYSMNSRVKQNTVVEFATDWEGGTIGIGELIYVLREENLYNNEASGIITAISGGNITVSNSAVGASKLLVFTRSSKQFIEFDITGVNNNVITLTNTTSLSVGDTYIIGDERLIVHRYITQNKSLDLESNECKLTGVNYPNDLESLVGLTVYSDYFNAIILP